MDLTSSIIAFDQATNANAVQYAVAGKILDQTRSQGAAIVQMIQAAGSAGKSDPLAAAASGLGGTLDVTA